MYYSKVEMDNFEKTRVIRQYRRSSLPRLRWTPELHDHFVEAVHSLGGKHSKFPFLFIQLKNCQKCSFSTRKVRTISIEVGNETEN